MVSTKDLDISLIFRLYHFKVEDIIIIRENNFSFELKKLRTGRMKDHRGLLVDSIIEFRKEAAP